MSAGAGTPAPLRVRKAERTRQSIVAAAIDLFDEHGYQATSVAQIAERAEVGERTFFRYFADKEEVLFVPDDELVALLVAALAPEHPDEPPATAAARAARTALEWLADRPQAHARERVIASSPALQARNLLKHARYAQVAQDALHTEHRMSAGRAALLAQLVVSCAMIAYADWIADQDGGGVAERLDRTLRRAAVELAPFAAG